VLRLCLIFVLASSVYNYLFPACSYITTATTTSASTSQHQPAPAHSFVPEVFYVALVTAANDIVLANRVVDVFSLLFLSSECATTIVHRATTHTNQHQHTHLCQKSSKMYNYFVAVDTPSALRVVDVLIYTFPFVKNLPVDRVSCKYAY
jgi:hypothetical protein